MSAALLQTYTLWSLPELDQFPSFLSVSESPFYFYHCEEGTPADSLRLDSSGNTTEDEERERAPPCGEATAVHLNERARDSSIATVLHSNSPFE